MPCNRVHIENLPGLLFQHERQYRSRHIEVTLDVHIDHFFPILHGQINPPGKKHQAGVVHQDVDGAVRFTRKPGKRLGLIRSGHVSSKRDHLTGGLAQISDERLQSLFIKGGGNHARTLRYQRPGGCRADA